MSDLISLETYKTAKALSSDKEDERLNLIITGVSQFIKTYCSSTFNAYIEDYKEELITVRGATNGVQLKETPVLEIYSVEEKMFGVYTALVEGSYELDDSTDVLYKVDGSKWATGINSVKVTYLAGYATIPYDLQLAAIDLVTYYWKEEHKTTRTVGANAMHNKTRSDVRDNMEVPDHIRRVLDKYRIMS